MACSQVTLNIALLWSAEIRRITILLTLHRIYYRARYSLAWSAGVKTRPRRNSFPISVIARKTSVACWKNYSNRDNGALLSYRKRGFVAAINRLTKEGDRDSFIARFGSSRRSNRHGEKRCQRNADLSGVLAFSETEVSFGSAGSRDSECQQNANRKKSCRHDVLSLSVTIYHTHIKLSIWKQLLMSKESAKRLWETEFSRKNSVSSTYS